MKAKWREFLKGEVQVKDEDKMNWEIRERAKQMMKDLLLIARKMPKRQRILIFKTPETRERLVVPLARELFNNASFASHGEKDYNAVAKLARGLETVGEKYDWVKLMEDKAYRERKEIMLKSKPLNDF